MIIRREFIALLGGAATRPLAAHAQQPERMRRIGVLMGWPESGGCRSILCFKSAFGLSAL